jgi:hypothetical protein
MATVPPVVMPGPTFLEGPQAIADKYAALGGDQGFLGLPASDIGVTPDGLGVYRHYQKGAQPDGSIYWTRKTGAWSIHGAIRDKWASLGWEKSELGYPVTDETGTPDGVGRYNHFQKGDKPDASVYWTPQTGAWSIHGAIRDKWASLGWEKSELGYPVTDEQATPDGAGRINHFEHGEIIWTAAQGAVVVPTVRTWGPESVTFSDGTALGGPITVVMNNKGDWTFSGHMHDSGFDSYDFTIAVAVMTPSGIAYTLSHTGHTQGTSANPFGPNRDNDWTSSGNNASIRDNWLEVFQGQLAWRIVAQDLLASALSDLLQQVIKDLISKGIAAGVTALIALV